MTLPTWIDKDVLSAIFNVLSAVIGAGGTYFFTRRREKSQQKKVAKVEARNEFDALIQANEKFRAEVRQELVTARKQISALEEEIKLKNKEAEELRNMVADIRTELASKEKRISDMKIEILNRDMQIEDLRRQINAVVAVQNRTLTGSIDPIG